jgi:chorismate mutase
MSTTPNPSEETKARPRETQRLIEGMRVENSLGKVVDDDFIRRNFSSYVFEGDHQLNDVIKALVIDESILKLNYADKVWYLVNDRFAIEEVYHKQLEDEADLLGQQYTSAKSKEDKKRIAIRQSVLKNIMDMLNKRLQTMSVITPEKAQKILSDNKKLQEVLYETIAEATRKYKLSFNIKDLATSQLLKRNRQTYSNVSFAHIMEVLSALEFTGKILIVPLPDHEKLFIDYAQFDQNVINHLDRERKLARSAAENSHSANTSGASKETKLGEYNNFMLLDNILKMGESRATQDFLKSRTIETHPSHQESSVSTQEGDAVKKKDQHGETKPNKLSNQIMGDLREKFILVPETEATETYDEFFLENLTDEKLDEELAKVVIHEDSQLLLKGYLEEIRKSISDIDRRIHFKTFFSCLAMLIRIPSVSSQKIHALAKVYLSRLGTLQLEKEKKIVESKLEAALAEYFEKQTEEKIFDSRPRLYSYSSASTTHGG